MVSLAEEAAGPSLPKNVFRQAIAAVLLAQEGRTILWAPVALVFGIWVYFLVDREPGWWFVAPFGPVAMVLFAVARGRGALALMALVLAGFVLAKAKAEWVAAPVLHATTAERLVTGRVAQISDAARGRTTIVLTVDAVEGMVTAEMPRRLRLSSTSSQGRPEVGWRVAVKAILAPLPQPVAPGGYDYGRALWWQGIGGTGRLVAPVVVLSQDIPAAYRFASVVAALRHAVNDRIAAALPGTSGAIGKAIITGERGSIPRPVSLSFQISGLAHVLAISGLHMALAAGGMFWFIRAILALIPSLALRYPIKKWAAAAAMMVGLFYMMLAGAGVATQRSYIMIAIVFFAILVDRPAISVRNLALAAIVILTFEPEAAVQASFQMSFLAVLGLTAFYEGWADYRRNRDPETLYKRAWPGRLMRGLMASLAAIVVTTLVAGTMSTIPAVYNFGRLAPYSILANTLALPIVSLLIMPMALLSVLAMPLGLEWLPLQVMGRGIDAMVAISGWVASLPGAYVVVPQQPAVAAIVSALGATVFCLVRGRARLAGIPVVIAGIVLSAMRPMPDVLVERTGAAVAVRSPEGFLVPAPGRKGRFAVGRWLLANGEKATPTEAAQRPGWTCETDRCSASVRGKTVLYLRGEGAGPAACGTADIVIADFPLRGACADVPLRVDRFDVWRNGAYALTVTGGTVQVLTARDAAGVRPWVVEPRRRTDPYRPPPTAGSGT